MKNFSITIDNKEYWISRSIAVTTFLFTIDKDNDLCVLANKRGIGTPDFQGYWNCPCGYLDYNETIIEAAKREVFEETGIICPDSITLFHINSKPTENKQNVTFKYYGFIKNPVFNSRSGEEVNEVEEVKWIKLKYIDTYKWAFNHDIIIKSLSKYLNELLNYD